MIKIETPVKGYNGIDCGIRFENGVATVESLTEHVDNWFKDQGYIVTSDKKVETPKIEDKGTPNIDNKPTIGDDNKKDDDNKILTKKELTVIAEGLGIEVKSKMTNAEIEALIEAKNIELENAGNAGNEDDKDKENLDPSNENENSGIASNENGDDNKKGE